MAARNRWTWEGLSELKAALRSLPDDLAEEATPIVVQAAEDAEMSVAAVYLQHKVTGKLAAGLRRVQLSRGRYAVAFRLENRAPHAHLFEMGTEVRHSQYGNRGRMPAFNAFIPRVARRRREMYRDLSNLLRKHGLTVKGTFD